MKWEEMSPRERDALVAEKVMGYEVSQRYASMILLPVAGEAFKEAIPWSPSTDISAAWEVVEKMKQTRTWAHVDSLKSGKWSAHFGQFDFSFSEADTAPEAICLSALRAVGVDV